MTSRAVAESLGQLLKRTCHRAVAICHCNLVFPVKLFRDNTARAAEGGSSDGAASRNRRPGRCCRAFDVRRDSSVGWQRWSPTAGCHFSARSRQLENRRSSYMRAVEVMLAPSLRWQVGGWWQRAARRYRHVKSKPATSQHHALTRRRAGGESRAIASHAPAGAGGARQMPISSSAFGHQAARRSFFWNATPIYVRRRKVVRRAVLAQSGRESSRFGDLRTVPATPRWGDCSRRVESSRKSSRWRT